MFLVGWGSEGYGDGQFEFPGSLAVDTQGNISVTDLGIHRVQKFAPPPTPVQGTTWGRIKSAHRD